MTRLVTFGAFELDLRARELRKHGMKIGLPEQSIQVLAMLLERPGEVVLGEEIQKNLWPNDTVVEFDHSINAAVKRLRRALGDEAETPRFVETLPRRGYRFIFPVNAGAGSTPAQPLGARLARPLSGTESTLIGRTVSHYCVLGVLGMGGMGVVYRAEDIRLGRLVALKFIPDELTDEPQALQRFEREAHAASTLNHPNICTIYEVEEHDGKPFIVMELLEGQTLRGLLAAPGSGYLPLDEILDLAIQIADGLDAAHQKGIIHRDIKPANIFITTRGQAKILDFGLAKLTLGVGPLSRPEAPPSLQAQQAASLQDQAAHLLDTPTASLDPEHLTRSGAAMGTAAYMSPEQIRGEKLDARTDLFSFGLVLYEMATGRQAFSGATTAIHDSILNRAPTPISSVNPDLPPKIEEIISKALEIRRDLRYQHASDLRTDLSRLKRETDSGRAAVVPAAVVAEAFPASGGQRNGNRKAAPREPVPARAAPKETRARFSMLVLERRLSLALGAVVLGLAAGTGAAWLLMQHQHERGKPVERQITANPPENFVNGAAISPDGKYIAYDDHFGLYLRSIDSGEARPVSMPVDFQSRMGNLEWFPDGGKLLVEVTGSESATDVNLWVITILGEAAPHLLYRHAEQPAISPDGRLIVFVGSNLQGQVQKAVLVGGINGESPRQLATGAPSELLSSPVWSPDGRWIAYARIKDLVDISYAGVIEVRPAGGGPAKTLVSPANLSSSSSPCNRWGDPCLRWAPDWRLLFSVSQAAASPSAQAEYSLSEIPVKPRSGQAAARPERLSQWSEIVQAGLWFGATSPTIAAGGKRLCFLKSNSWAAVYVGELTPDGTSMKASRRLTLDKRGSYPNSWTRDSKAIIFDSLRSGKNEIFRQGLNDNVAETVAQSSMNCDIPMLSPDGSWILYRESPPAPPGAARSLSRLMRRPVAGGSPETVLEQPGDMWWYYRCPLKADSSCVLSQYEGQDLVFYALDPVRGKGEQLGEIKASPSRVSIWDISPDGSRLAVVGGYDMYQGRIEVLTLRDPAARHEVPVEPGWGILQSISWAVDGKSFFVTSYLPSSFGLLHVTFTGKVSPLFRNPGLQWMWNPVPSPDGKYLAYQAFTHDSNVWMLENF